MNLSRRIFTASILVAVSLCMSAAPRPSPDFTINIVNGQPLHLSQYRGKVVVLAFIITTCPHCQAATRMLSGLQKEFGPRGLQVLEAAISMQPDMEVPKFIETYSPAFPVGSTSYQEVMTYMGYGPKERRYTPYVTFIDRAGMIQGQFDGMSPFNDETVQLKNYRAIIEKLLAGK